MKPLYPKIFAIAVLLITTLITGFWLKKLGRPYPGYALTVHKLLVIGMVVVGILMFKELKALELTGIINYRLLVVAITFLLIAILSGGLQSVKEPFIQNLPIIHWVSWIISTSLIAYIIILTLKYS